MKPCLNLLAIINDYDYISSDHFATLHCNIRSLNSNFDNFVQMLSELSCNFSVIGLSETRISVNQENLSNNQLEDYTFVSQPSLSNAGGVGFFINDNLLYKIRHDLSESVTGLETLWIELPVKLNHNLIVCVIYRHRRTGDENLGGLIAFRPKTFFTQRF